MEDKLVYHYTIFEAFLSIVRSNSLWASDLEALNDPSELSNARQSLYALVVLRQRNSLMALALRRERGMMRLPSLRQFAGESQEQYRHFAELAADYLSGFSADSHWDSAIGHVFGISFCRTPDLLSQWRAYGLNGSGVCVGFDRSELDVYVQSHVRNQRLQIPVFLA